MSHRFETIFVKDLEIGDVLGPQASPGVLSSGLILFADTPTGHPSVHYSAVVEVGEPYDGEVTSDGFTFRFVDVAIATFANEAEDVGSRSTQTLHVLDVATVLVGDVLKLLPRP